MDYGKYIAHNRFEEITNNIQFSESKGRDHQILDYLEAVNHNLNEAIIPGDSVCLDENTVKSFHKGLKGKEKIIRKLHPIGNEFKNVADGNTNMVTNLELYEGKEYNANQEACRGIWSNHSNNLAIDREYPWYKPNSLR